MAVTGPYYDNVRMGGVKGLRVPEEVEPATLAVIKSVAHSYGSASADWNLSAIETGGSVYSVTLAGGAVNAIFPVYIPGKVFVVNNGSGQAVTFLVKGKTGIVVANAKSAILCMDAVALDVQRATADTTASS